MSDRPEGGAFVPGPRELRESTGRGVLDGLRLAVKDLVDVEGCVTGGGNPDWAAAHGPAACDAPVVAALRANGARVVGKTVTDEFAFSLEGENAHYGTPTNPRAPGCLPGGSSSGSAAAVAAGAADIALGTDTGGSVRVPASFCGVWAMRPTHGRIGLQGVLPFAPGYDTVGWFARDADSLGRVGQVLLGSDATGPPLRLRMADDAVALADHQVALALRGFAAAQGIAGGARAFDDDPAEAVTAYATLQALDIQRSLGPWLRARRPRLGSAIAPRFADALAVDRGKEAGWRSWRQAFRSRLLAALGPDDAWLLPAAPCTALPRNAPGQVRSRFYERALALGAIAGHAGAPQVVLPLLSVAGRPLAVSFIAAPGQDERLLALARRFADAAA